MAVTDLATARYYADLLDALERADSERVDLLLYEPSSRTSAALRELADENPEALEAMLRRNLRLDSDPVALFAEQRLAEALGALAAQKRYSEAAALARTCGLLVTVQVGARAEKVAALARGAADINWLSRIESGFPAPDGVRDPLTWATAVDAALGEVDGIESPD